MDKGGVNGADIESDGLFESTVVHSRCNRTSNSLVVSQGRLTTERRRGLGVFSVLQHLELARARGIPHLYLGYWIADNPSMSYNDGIGYIEQRFAILSPRLVLLDATQLDR